MKIFLSKTDKDKREQELARDLPNWKMHPFFHYFTHHLLGSNFIRFFAFIILPATILFFTSEYFLLAFKYRNVYLNVCKDVTIQALYPNIKCSDIEKDHIARKLGAVQIHYKVHHDDAVDRILVYPNRTTKNIDSINVEIGSKEEPISILLSR